MKQIVIGHLSEEDAPAVWQAVLAQADELRKLAPGSTGFYLDVRDEEPLTVAQMFAGMAGMSAAK